MRRLIGYSQWQETLTNFLIGNSVSQSSTIKSSIRLAWNIKPQTRYHVSKSSGVATKTVYGEIKVIAVFKQEHCRNENLEDESDKEDAENYWIVQHKAASYVLGVFTEAEAENTQEHYEQLPNTQNLEHKCRKGANIVKKRWSNLSVDRKKLYARVAPVDAAGHIYIRIVYRSVILYLC